MNTIKFKTSIKCGGCIASLSDALDQVAGKENWTVDLLDKDKVLTVKTELESTRIIGVMKAKGFSAEVI